jgi:tRNA A22 N-methylase
MAAYNTVTSHKKMRLIQELHDETVFTFDSVDDFVTALQPKRNTEMVKDFLKAHHFMLEAERRILVFQKK